MNKVISNEIKKLYLNGTSLREIQKITGIHRKKVANYLELIGIKKKINKWNTGLTYENSEKIREISSRISKTLTNRRISGIHKLRIGLKNKGRKHTEESKEKLRLTHLGKKNPNQSIRMKLNNPMKREDCRERLSERVRGEKNIFWQGGLTKNPYKNFNSLIKRRVRKRDNQVCMLCGIHREELTRALDVHHINYDKTLSIAENLISLCKSCHVRTNFNREEWKIFFQSLLSKRYGYDYSNDKKPIINLNKEINNVI